MTCLYTSCEEEGSQLFFYAQIPLRPSQLHFLSLQHLWRAGSRPCEAEVEMGNEYAFAGSVRN